MRRNLVLLVMLLAVSACGDGRPQVAEPAVPGRAVAAYDRATGELLWRKEVEPPSAATDPVLVDGVAVVASSGPLVAYDARTAERLWSLEDVRVPPQVAGNALVLQLDGTVQAVEARTGRSLWRLPLERDAQVFAGPGGVAVLRSRIPGPEAGPPTPGRVEGPGEVRLLAARDGAELWSVDVVGPPTHAYPASDLVAVGGLRGSVTALALADGRQLWQSASGLGPQVLVAGSRVLARSDTALTGYDASTGAQVWQRPSVGLGPPLLASGGAVAVPDFDEELLVLGVQDGETRSRGAAAWDVALTGAGLVLCDLEVVQARTMSGQETWRREVAGGVRPALRIDADDDVVVAVTGWGQPPARD